MPRGSDDSEIVRANSLLIDKGALPLNSPVD
nr:MAG TPA: hypothetical protein [Caudoviricetes sp.]